MRTIVCKFGGSSTANPARFGRILDIVRSSPARRFVVLSAPGIDANHGEKVTSMLERCWLERENAKNAEETAWRVALRFDGIADALGVEGFGQLVREEIDRAMRVSREHVLSRGEYLCALLFSRWSGIPMLDSARCIAFHSHGDHDEIRTGAALSALAEKGGRFVIPGFYGADPEGRIRTFPRNGSDISGALIAAGTGAALYENWTDVPGLMSADPDIVPDAHLIPQISYGQMRALSRAGAQVLHPDCLDSVAMAGIPTRLRSTLRPDCFGTLIDEHCSGIASCLAIRKEARLPRSDTSPGDPIAACISVFGSSADQVRAASAAFSPLWMEYARECVHVYVERPLCRRCARALHEALIALSPASNAAFAHSIVP